MKPFQELAKHLLRPEVAELALATGKPACVKIDGAWKPVDEEFCTTDDVFLAITSLAGMPFVTKLSPAPIQAPSRMTGVGDVMLTAARSGDSVTVRIVCTRKDPSTGTAPPKPAAPAVPARAPAAAPPRAPEAAAAPPAPAPTPRPPALPALGASPTLGSLLQHVQRLSATDLHLVGGRPALFRIAGELLPQGPQLTSEVVDALLVAEVPPRCREALEVDGSCDFALDRPEFRLRVNIGRQRTGMKGCFRVIPKEVPTLESLGLPEQIAESTHHHQGLIVVTGPTGHGKTTTMAAIVNLINSHSSHHVITVEDPVEYLHPRKKALLSQREVGSHTRTFQSALKGSLREDPDVLVVGELRDTETVRMALSASETGHLVIATMNTPSAAKTIDRLIDLFPPGDQGQVRVTLSSALRLVLSQRLVPTTNRDGVVAAVELLPGSVALANLIRDNKTFQIPSLQQRGKSVGIIRLEDSLAELVKAGKTSLEIAKEFTSSPDDLAAMVTGKRPLAPGMPDPAAEKPAGGGLMGKMGSLVGRKG